MPIHRVVYLLTQPSLSTFYGAAVYPYWYKKKPEYEIPKNPICPFCTQPVTRYMTLPQEQIVCA